MGGETSTLSGIESLSNSLNDIERKLNIIEDMQYHNEQITAYDNSTIIADKRIDTSPSIHIVVGPVIGLVGTVFARALIETNESTKITLNVFELDYRYEKHGRPRFLFEKIVDVSKNQPIVVQVNDLTPDTSYSIHIGGVNYFDTLRNYATFKTLPLDRYLIRTLFIRNGQVDQFLPEERRVWPDIEKIVVDNENIFTGTSKSTVHYLFHCGGTLRLHERIRSKCHDLIHMLLNKDTSTTLWTRILKEIEELINDTYRQAFTENTSFRNILRKTANIFLAGEMEIAIDILSILANDEFDPSVAQSHDESISNQAQVKPPSENNQSTDESDSAKMEIAHLLNFDSNDMNDDQKLAQIFLEEKILRRTRSKSLQQIYDDDADHEASMENNADSHRIENQSDKQEMNEIIHMTNFAISTKKVLAGLIARIARRAYLRYMRWLWDDQCDLLIRNDLETEDVMIKMICLQRELMMLKTEYQSFLASRNELATKFGALKTSLKPITTRMHSIVKDMRKLERQMLSQQLRLNQLQSIDRPCVRCGNLININGVGLLIIDTFLEILKRDGTIRSFTKESMVAPLDEQIYQDLDSVLEYSGSKVSGNPEEQYLHTIVVVSSSPLYPSKGHYEKYSSISSANKMILLSVHDSTSLIERLCRWQQHRNENIALIATPPYEDQHKPVQGHFVAQASLSEAANHDEGWSDRSRLTVILLPSLQYRSEVKSSIQCLKSYLSNVDLIPSQNCQQNIFEAVFVVDANTRLPGQKGYWDVTLKPPQRGQISSSSTGSEFMNIPAMTQSMCHEVFNRLHAGTISLGPIIGHVSYHHALILFEFTIAGYVQLAAVDQLTGEMISFLKYVSANRPSVFHFSDLKSGHYYDIIINSSESSDSTVREIHQCSFRTLQRVYSLEDTEAKTHRKHLITDLLTQENQIREMNDRMEESSRTESKSKAPSRQRNQNISLKSGKSSHHPSISANSSISSIQTSMRASTNNPVSQSHSTAAINTQLTEKYNNSDESNTTIDLKTGNIDLISLESQNHGQVKILVIGGDQRHGFIDDLDEDRNNDAIQKGLTMFQQLTYLVSNPTSQVDLMIIIGSVIDYTVCRDSIRQSLIELDDNIHLLPRSSLSDTLSLAISPNQVHFPGNELIYNDQQNREISHVQRIIDRIRRNLKLCYQYQLNSIHGYHYRHQSHLILSDPMLDLLNFFEADSYDSLQRDQSISSIQCMQSLLQSLHDDYILALRRDDSLLSAWLADMSLKSYVEMIGNDVCIFHLRPNLITSSYRYGLIDSSQLNELRQVCDRLVSYAVNHQKKVPLLLVTSTLPIISPDLHCERMHMESSSLSTDKDVNIPTGVYYSHEDVSSLLDVLSESWICDGRGHAKQALLLCSGLRAFETEISICHKSQGSKSVLGSVKQICVGLSLGIGCFSYQTPSQSTETNLTLFSKLFDYNCQTSYASTSPQIAIINTDQSISHLPIAVPVKYDSNLFQVKIASTLMSFDQFSTSNAVLRNGADWSSVFQNRGIEELWKKIVYHVNVIEMAIVEEIETESDPLIDRSGRLMLMALNHIMSVKHRQIFDDSFERYRTLSEEKYSIVGSSYVKYFVGVVIGQIWDWLLQSALPCRLATMLPRPSSFTIAIMIDMCVDMIRSGQDRLQVPSSLSREEQSVIKGTQSNEMPIDNATVVFLSFLKEDKVYFLSFLQKVMSSQILVEHFTQMEGQNKL